MSTKYIADLHCHVSLKPFRNTDKNIWEKLPKPKDCGGLLITLANLGELLTESRTNLKKSIEGNVRLLFITLMPVERTTFDLRSFLDFFVNQEELGRCISGFGEKYTKEILKSIEENEKIDYLSEMMSEFQYLKEQELIESNGYKFKLAANYEEATRLLNESDKNIVGILTIEGVHAFNVYDYYNHILGTEFKDVNDPTNDRYKHFEAKFEAGISQVKTTMGDYTPFFTTLTHHFWNLLCGHAQSYSSLFGDLAIKQDKFSNRGFTELGKKVMRQLLSKENGRRILIDTKHMSLLTRKEFYDMWETEFAANGDAFPIICSHAAVNGKDNFEKDAKAFIKKEKKKKKKNRKRDKDKHKKGYYFNRWSINLYDTDIKMIAKSKGVIGIILHEDRLPGNFSRDKIKLWEKRLKRVKKGAVLTLENGEILTESQAEDALTRSILQLILANIFYIVRICNDKTAWNIIGLGTDFDGIINGLAGYSDFAELKHLPTHLLQYMSRIEAEDSRYAIVENKAKDKDKANFAISELKGLMFGLSAQEIVDKIFYQNVEDFMKRYYNDAYLKKQVSPPPPPIVAGS